MLELKLKLQIPKIRAEFRSLKQGIISAGRV